MFFYQFQEGAKSISVWQLETRTTCAVEAINGVLGRGIPGNSNFFNFVHFIQKFEAARWLKIRNIAARCVLKRKRKGQNEKSVLIRSASELLDKNEITVDEFLTNIAKFKDNKLRQHTHKHVISYSSDEDDSNDVDAESQSSQPSAKRSRTDSINLCRVCDTNESNTILFPCSHAVLCFECWTKKSLLDDKYCVECFGEVKSVHKFN